MRVVSKTDDNSSSKDELQKVAKKRLKAAPTTSSSTPTPAAVTKPTIVTRKLSTDSPAAATLGIKSL